MAQPGSSLAPGEGNTKPPQNASKRISSSKSWCFTHNNFSEAQLSQVVSRAEKCGLKYIVGKEVGESGTPHLQGFVHHPTKKFRPMECLNLEFKPHWEKCKGSFDDNVAYCSKDGDFITNIEIESDNEELIVDEPYGWQLEVKDIIEQTPCRRTIYWFWEPHGNMGKSTLCRWLCIKKNAQICAGKAADMKYQISREKKHPKVIVFDVPRSNMEYISYTGIEEIKQGIFASQKYESGMHKQNWPHVFVFANEPPKLDKMSMDRWQVRRIDQANPPAAGVIDPLRDVDDTGFIPECFRFQDQFG